MCFSANISFLSSFILMGIGVLSLMKSRKKELMFASIPILFAIQQASEGFLWLSLISRYKLAASMSSAMFLTFAFIVWPVWIPWSLVLMENNRYRKIIIKVLGWIGIIISLLFLSALAIKGYSVFIFHNHIRYIINASKYINTYLNSEILISIYSLVTILPFFISGRRGLWIFGYIIIISCLFSYFLWQLQFISIWCFFAAILSSMIYLFVNADKKTQD